MSSLNDRVEAFESAIARGVVADIDQFLPEPEHPEFAAIVIELARVEIESRGEADEGTVTSYIKRFPTVFSKQDYLEKLAFEEFRVRRQSGEGVDRREYALRYNIDTSAWPAIAPLPANTLSSERLQAVSDGGHSESAMSRGFRVLLPRIADIDLPRLREWLAKAFPEFDILEEVGRGAFGRVFLARQKTLANREVVIKVTSDTTSEPERLAALQHTHIVPVYSVHRTTEWQAICMPFFGRRTLKDLIEETHSNPPCNQSDISTALRHIRQVSMGLQHAHENAVLHRDIKPANILITDHDQAMLLDFNLSSDVVAQSLSRSIVGGTIPYLSPEHLQSLETGDSVSVSADIYSVGIILFEYLTGRLPFPHASGMTLRQIVAEAVAAKSGPVPSVRSVRPEISHAVDAIIRKCLQPAPQKRYRSTAELTEDLECEIQSLPLRFADNDSAVERFQKWRKRHPRLLSVSSLMVTLIVTLISGIWTWSSVQGRVDQLRQEARWDYVGHQLPDVRTMLSAPDASAADLQLGMAKGWEILAIYTISKSTLPSNVVAELHDQTTRLSPAYRDSLRQSLFELTYLMASGSLRESRVIAQTTDRERLLAEAEFLNQVCSALCRDRQSTESLRLQSLAIRSSKGEDVSSLLTPSPQHPQSSPSTGESGTGETGNGTPGTGTLNDFISAIQMLEAGRTDAALQQFEELVQAYPHDYSAWHLLGKARQLREEWAAADAAFSTCIALRPECVVAWRDRGICRLHQEQGSLAESDFTEVIRRQPTAPDGYVNRSLAQIQQQKLMEAEADLKRSLELGGPTRAWFILSSLKQQLRDDDGARRYFERGLAAEPNESDSWVARGVALLAVDSEAALTDFRRALTINPMNRDAMQNIAHVLAEQLQKPEQAIEQLNTLLQCFPEDRSARIGRAVLFARLNDSTHALEDVETVLQNHPEAIEVYQAACTFALLSRNNPMAFEHRCLSTLRESLNREPVLYQLAESDADLLAVTHLKEFQQLINSGRNLSSPIHFSNDHNSASAQSELPPNPDARGTYQRMTTPDSEQSPLSTPDSTQRMRPVNPGQITSSESY